MSVVYSATVKSNRMQKVIDNLDASASPDLFASIQIRASASPDQILVTIPLQRPSFVESGGVITLQGVPKSATASGTGTASLGRLLDGAGNIIVDNLSVGAGSGEINLNSTSITSGQTVSITSGTITHG